MEEKLERVQIIKKLFFNSKICFELIDLPIGIRKAELKIYIKK